MFCSGGEIRKERKHKNIYSTGYKSGMEKVSSKAWTMLFNLTDPFSDLVLKPEDFGQLLFYLPINLGAWFSSSVKNTEPFACWTRTIYCGLL